MKSLVERLKEQKEQSSRYSEANFGLRIGDGYPELVRELMADEGLAQALVMEYLLMGLTGHKVAARVGELIKEKRTSELLNVPEVYKQPTSWLYWGIEIGRQLERENVAAPESAVTP